MMMTTIAKIGVGGLLGMAASALAATVQVDLVPCILAPTTIAADSVDTAETYVVSKFYKGYWGASQLTPAATNGTLDLTNTTTHGKCNVVYVGIEVTEAQKTQLQDYSRTFSVRIVYFNSAATSTDPEVNARLGIAQDFTDPLLSAPFIRLASDGTAVARVVQPTLTTDPREFNLLTRPVYATGEPPSTNGTVSVIAEYVDAAGANVPSSLSFPSAAAMAYTSVDGYEELHLFFSLAWFDIGSWAWIHFVVEWGTKGVFQGERRFHLAAMVDDLFLATAVFEYDGVANEGPKQRMTAFDMDAFSSFEASLNSQYNSTITTEWPFTGLGILDMVDSAYAFRITTPGAGLLPKGEKVVGEGIAQLTPFNWLADAVPGMTAEFNGGLWAADDLLAWVLSNLDTFWWQSHTLSHLMRDDLGRNDCENEDSGLVQIAVLTGMFASENYNWRSITPPGITGHFNKYCMASATANLMTCAPGDNTFNGILTDVSLVSNVSDYHSIYTTEAINGFTGFQIVPRFATAVYFNCATGDCLVTENEYLRRVVCGCANLDPALDKGICASCDGDIGSFSILADLYAEEATTTSRYLLMGRRDKYMFHQANVIQNSAIPAGSLLAYWYQEVMAKFSQYIAFPVTSNKFDDQCTEFTLHEDLDGSGAVLTATVDNVSGLMSNITLSASGTAGVIPLTVPATSILPTDGLTVGSCVTYGSDTTYYVATSAEAVPVPATAPNASELAPIGIQTDTATNFTATTPAPVAVGATTAAPVAVGATTAAPVAAAAPTATAPVAAVAATTAPVAATAPTANMPVATVAATTAPIAAAPPAATAPVATVAATTAPIAAAPPTATAPVAVGATTAAPVAAAAPTATAPVAAVAATAAPITAAAPVATVPATAAPIAAAPPMATAPVAVGTTTGAPIAATAPTATAPAVTVAATAAPIAAAAPTAAAPVAVGATTATPVAAAAPTATAPVASVAATTAPIAAAHPTATAPVATVSATTVPIAAAAPTAGAPVTSAADTPPPVCGSAASAPPGV
ncbi:unnamed protein product [Pylaiella littoralis]